MSETIINAENISRKPTDVVVIGGGDCAANRLVPALIAKGIAPKNIHVYALRHDSLLQQGCLKDELREIDLHTYQPDSLSEDYVVQDLLEDASDMAREKGAPVLVVSPSFAHLGYVKKFLEAGLVVGCEKPLTCFADEIDPFREIIDSEAGKRLFGLSYYALEKGLPLTWFKNPGLDLPEGLLEAVGADGALLDAKSLNNLRELTNGPVKETRILLLEGGERSKTDDYRGWTVDPRYGGNPVETGIHPLLLASLAHAVKPEDLHKFKISTGLFEGYNSEAPATYADYSTATTSLVFGKHIHKDNLFRGGWIDYENGARLEFDFDSKNLKILRDGQTKAEIRVAEPQNYAAQVDQFLRFVEKGGWQEEKRGDFALEQLDILRQITTAPTSSPALYSAEAKEQRLLLPATNFAPQHKDKRLIASKDIVVQIDDVGGAMSSLCVRNPETEILGHWKGSTGVTSGFVMAPIVGSISESGRFKYQGEVFEPGKHGFARKTPFTCIGKSENGIILRYTHDPEKMPGVYPFRHQIKLEYTVNANSVTARLLVSNLDDRTMYFGSGFHPAFAWPLPGNASQDGHSLILKLSLPERTLVYRPVDGKVYSDAQDVNPFNKNEVWNPSPQDFRKDAYFFNYPEGSNLDTPSLVRFQGNPQGAGIDVRMTGHSGFGIWSKPDSDSRFLCIEPFAGVPIIDRTGKTPELENIRGLQRLMPGKTFATTMVITPR